jgi:hypothetical protein
MEVESVTSSCIQDEREGLRYDYRILAARIAVDGVVDAQPQLLNVLPLTRTTLNACGDSRYYLEAVVEPPDAVVIWSIKTSTLKASSAAFFSNPLEYSTYIMDLQEGEIVEVTVFLFNFDANRSYSGIKIKRLPDLVVDAGAEFFTSDQYNYTMKAQVKAGQQGTWYLVEGTNRYNL